MEKAFTKPYENGWDAKPASNSWVTPEIMDNYDNAIDEIDNRVIGQSEDLTQFSNDGYLPKNKFDKNNYMANVGISANVISSNTNSNCWSIKCEVGKTYTLTKASMGSCYLGFLDTKAEMGKTIDGRVDIQNKTTITFVATREYAILLLSKAENLDIVQFEEGSATPYTPYAPSNIELNENLTQLVNYSTNEVAIGKWIDGKTIYRRVINVGHVGSNAVVNVATISGISEIVRLYGKAKANDYAQQYPLPFLSLNASFDIVILIQSEYVQIRTGSGFGETGIDNVVIVAEYTK